MTTLKVVTLNTWGKRGPWQARRALIGDELRALAPHVIALNEVWDDGVTNSARELAAAIGGEWHVHYGAAFEAEGRTEGNAILSRFPFAACEQWPLPEPTHDHGRGLIYAACNTPWGTLPVFATHLSWMFHHGAARLQQVQQIREWMKERAPIQRGDTPTDQLPPLLVGDLNAVATADEIRFLRGELADPYGCYLADCFAHCGDGPGYTWHHRNRYAARECYPDRRLDYIFVRGPDRWRRGQPLAARVVLDQPRAGVFASDHFAVYAELRAVPFDPPALIDD